MTERVPIASVLVVDDEKSVRYMLRQVLERTGYRVFEASNGHEALRVLDEHNADLLIIDIIMPKKDGIETVIEIRRRSPDLPIVAISGGGGPPNLSYLDIARKFGADHILRKPFSVVELLNVVNKALGKAK